MTIFEALGYLFVIFFACVGIATVAIFTYCGLMSMLTRAALGKVTEDTAIANHLPKLEVFRSVFK